MRKAAPRRCEMGKIAVLFAGQGAQYPGMGRDICSVSAKAQKVFDMGESITPGIKQICFDSDADILSKTENTQPALFLTDLACAYALLEAGIVGDFAAGFSLGEIAALAYCGILSDSDAYKLVCTRGLLMAKCAEKHPGAMAAVLKLTPDTVEKICSEFKEIYPDLPSHGLEALTDKFKVELNNHHRAMADTMGLALAYPKLKKLYLQRLDWQKKQLDNVDYLFDRYLRIQQSIATMQAELQDLKSIFKLHFELGGEPLVAETGEMMVYQSKQSFGYDLADIKEVLENVGALEKAVKVNNGFIDRLCNGLSLSEEYKQIIKDARQEISETRNIQVIKPCRQ